MLVALSTQCRVSPSIMDVFEIDESASRSINKSKLSFLTSKGAKRSLTLLIILTIVSIIYTLQTNYQLQALKVFWTDTWQNGSLESRKNKKNCKFFKIIHCAYLGVYIYTVAW